MVQAVNQNQPDFIPADDTPDFIPDSGEHLSAASRSAAYIPFPTKPKAPAPLRFVGGALGTYLDATLNAGPTSGTPPSYGTPEWQQAEKEFKANPPSVWQTLKNSFAAIDAKKLPAAALNDAVGTASKFASDATGSAEGAGSALMKLLLLRQGFKGGKLPVRNLGDLAGVPESQFGPLDLSGASGPKPQLALPPAPIELGPSSAIEPTQEGVLPAASILRRSPQGELIRQYLTRSLRQGESQPVNKDTNSLSQDYFIQKARESLEQQPGTGEAEQQAAQERMDELNRQPGRFQSQGTKYAYRVRDVGEQGLMPKGHAQASMDLAEAHSYVEGRASAQGTPQELVRVDLSKLNPDEYTLVSGPNGKQWVQFKGAVPESFISKVPKSRLQKLQESLAQPQTKSMTSGQDLIDALRQMVSKPKSMSATAGKD